MSFPSGLDYGLARDFIPAMACRLQASVAPLAVIGGLKPGRINSLDQTPLGAMG